MAARLSVLRTGRALFLDLAEKKKFLTVPGLELLTFGRPARRATIPTPVPNNNTISVEFFVQWLSVIAGQ
jgi:hypothetical protein